MLLLLAISHHGLNSILQYFSLGKYASSQQMSMFSQLFAVARSTILTIKQPNQCACCRLALALTCFGLVSLAFDLRRLVCVHSVRLRKLLADCSFASADPLPLDLFLVPLAASLFLAMPN